MVVHRNIMQFSPPILGGMLGLAMVMVAACVLTPSVYLALNSPAALIGTTPEQAAQVLRLRWRWT
ncbi:hypothetical protein HDN1F_04880 [gamma proteobacterium HdN1]|nr:hypothetical protein HDN1F_04880 [gamma proteobacterium HdN1]